MRSRSPENFEGDARTCRAKKNDEKQNEITVFTEFDVYPFGLTLRRGWGGAEAGGEGRATQPHFQQRLLISVAVCAAGPAACSRLMPPPARHEPSPQ